MEKSGNAPPPREAQRRWSIGTTNPQMQSGCFTCSQTSIGPLEKVVADQNAINQQMWDRVAQLVAFQQQASAPMAPAMTGPQLLSGVRAQNMTPEDDPEAFINSFERTAVADRWPPAPWSAILIPCLIGPA